MNDGTIRLGYNGTPWVRRRNSADRFHFEADRAVRGETLEREAIRAAKEIGERYHGEEIVLLCGGGMDSEAMAVAFERAGVRHRIVCIADINGANAEELALLDRPAEMIAIDMLDVVKSSISRVIAEDIQQSHSCMMYFQSVILDKLLGLPVVLGFGEPVIHNLPCCGYTLVEEEFDYSTYLFFRLYSLHGTPSFWHWSTELYHAWLRTEPHVHELKHDLLSKAFGIKPRPKVSWHEKIQVWTNERWTQQWAVSLHKLLALSELELA